MTILQALVGHYDRLANTGQAPEYGYSKEKISYALVLSSEGDVLDTMPLSNTSSSRPRPKLETVPRPVVRTSGIAANYLWDKTAYVLGVKRDKDSNQIVFATDEFAAFKELHEKLLANQEEPGLSALLKFLRKWEPADYESLNHAADLVDTNIVFRLDGEHSFLHDRQETRKIWVEHLESHEGAGSFCLVTGTEAPFAQTHAKIKGVAGAQSSGGSLVSFNLDAFKSYSKEQGANAPVSERAAFAYTTALNSLLAFDSRQRIQIGDTTTVFWAEANGDGQNAEAAEDMFSMLIGEPKSTDASETAKIADVIEKISKGTPIPDVNPRISEGTRFFVLGLAPNSARISIRFWYEDTIGAMADRIRQHWRDLHLDPLPWQYPPSAWRMLLETAPQGKSSNIPPILVGGLLRAILTGSRYPQNLLSSVVARMRADKKLSPLRAAICKACIERDYRLGFEQEGMPVSLNTEEANAAYRLGRLFAMYESIQRTALGKTNSTIKDRYFGAASATPASVFPLLERGSAHHLATLRKRGEHRLAFWFEQEIDSIFAGVDTAFPNSLRLAEQGRFAIGYHHQRSRKSASERADGDAQDHDSDSNDET